MKRNYFWMMLVVLASVLGLASCSSSNDPVEDTYVGGKLQLEVGALDLELYDITISYTDLMSGMVQTQKLLTPTWSYNCVSATIKEPAQYVLKIEGTPKANAKDIAKALADKGTKMKEGCNYEFHYGVFKDMGMQYPASGHKGLSSKNELMISLSGDKIVEFLEKNPTLHIFDAQNLVK